MIDLEPLSKEARALAGVWFGMMDVGRGSVTHHLVEWRPTARTQEAINELLAAGVISVEPLNQHGGKTYRPLVDCMPAFKWMNENITDPDLKFSLMEKVETYRPGITNPA